MKKEPRDRKSTIRIEWKEATISLTDSTVPFFSNDVVLRFITQHLAKVGSCAWLHLCAIKKRLLPYICGIYSNFLEHEKNGVF